MDWIVFSLVVLMKRAGGKRPFPGPPIAQLPRLLLGGLAVAAMIIFLLLMEMRASACAG